MSASPRRVAILISGTGSNMMALLDAMEGEACAGVPAIIVANDPAAAGLGRAAARGVPVAAVDHRPFGKDRAGFEAALSDALAPHAPDLICLAGFMRILTADFVRMWEGRMLNVHPSLLPKYRGLDTHARALAAGEAEHGCTVHLVTPELDDGPILGQARVPVLPDDTVHTLAARVQQAEHRLYPAVLTRLLAGDRTPLQLA